MLADLLPCCSAKNSDSGLIASRIAALLQSPDQHLYLPVLGSTLRLCLPHTGQVYLFLSLPGSSLFKWSRMSKEPVLSWLEISKKSDAEFDPVG